uniref:Reverse transcriptase zinc-binding domain-containing protein n=1 Tax=Cannabis sativa TaxID=3483 RepID=A0A803P5G6_CANSA
MGLIMVKFNDEATRDQVLESRVLQFDRKPEVGSKRNDQDKPAGNLENVARDQKLEEAEEKPLKSFENKNEVVPQMKQDWQIPKKIVNQARNFAHLKASSGFEDAEQSTWNSFKLQISNGCWEKDQLSKKQGAQGSSLNLDQQLLLLKLFIHKEIRKAMFTIPYTKSLGPDSFGYGFFKSMWSDIGFEICKAVTDFFSSGKMPLEFHSTMISLTPKIYNPVSAVDFGPITCCSTIYKCILKLLCFRLAKVLPYLINQNWGAFIQGTRKLVSALKNIINEFSFSSGSFPLKYLEVPLRPTRWKADDCVVILKKISQRLHSWSSRHLLFTGRVQLIHSVLLGLYNYWMSIFMLPQSVIKEVEKLCKGFIWGLNGSMSKIHVASWEKVCLPKAYGGLGFKDGAKWNHANLAKYIWAILAKRDLLWARRLYNNSLSQNLVHYHRVVWSSLTFPKQQFVLWKAVNLQLLTKDNLVKFDLEIESLDYPVCDAEFETHVHLYFISSLSRQVVDLIFGWLGKRVWLMDRVGWQSWLAQPSLKLFQVDDIAVFAATCYNI